MMIRQLVILLAAFCTFSVGAAAKQPNVLLILTDDQGYGDIGFHGNSMLQTPEIDALARQSLRLTNFHVEPTCAETRAALMSGQFPLRVGVWHTILGRSIMNAEAVTMPQIFQASGYRTGMFGKWHLGDNYPYRPQDRGFETTLHHGGGGVGQTPDVWGNDYFDDVYLSRDELRPVRGYCTDVFFEAAEEFIKAESEQPFFCYLATNAPHGPYLVDEAYKKPYLEKGVAEPMASFYGMIANIDENVGQLLEMLDARELSDETIVVFMTDNGTAAGYQANADDGHWGGFNAGMRGTKGTQYDGGHRVPCFMRLPNGKHAGSEVERLTAHIDLIPTLAGLCNIDVSKVGHLDGQNLLPLVNARTTPEPRTLVVQSHRVEAPRKWMKSSVLTDDWRLVDGEALYAIKDDVGQINDVAAENPDVVRKLRQAYESWWQDCAPQPANYSRIPIGDPNASIVRLTAHDWHGPSPPWNQDMIRAANTTNGVWEVTIQRPGNYQFWLARQPLAEPRPLNCRQAALRVGSVEAVVDVSPSSVLVPINLELAAGKASLSTELIDERGDSMGGAFYVYASYLEQTPVSAELPEWLLPGDRIAWIGGTLIERAQESGQFEAQWLAHAPTAGLTFCNLGWSGDDVRGRARNVFGDLNEGRSRRERDLDLAAPSLVITAYGMSEALGDSITDDEFRHELTAFTAQQIAAGRRVVLCHIPDFLLDANAPAGIQWNEVIARYRDRRTKLDKIIDEVASEAAQRTAVIDLPALRTSWFESAQYVSPEGYLAWSRKLASSALGGKPLVSDSQLQRLASLSQRANRQFFEMHRPQNETYLFLFRKHEQGNNAVEPLQNRPLLAETQLQMLRAAGSQ